MAAAGCGCYSGGSLSRPHLTHSPPSVGNERPSSSYLRAWTISLDRAPQRSWRPVRCPSAFRQHRPRRRKGSVQTVPCNRPKPSADRCDARLDWRLSILRYVMDHGRMLVARDFFGVFVFGEDRGHHDGVERVRRKLRTPPRCPATNWPPSPTTSTSTALNAANAEAVVR